MLSGHLRQSRKLCKLPHEVPRQIWSQHPCINVIILSYYVELRTTLTNQNARQYLCPWISRNKWPLDLWNHVIHRTEIVYNMKCLLNCANRFVKAFCISSVRSASLIIRSLLALAAAFAVMINTSLKIHMGTKLLEYLPDVWALSAPVSIPCSAHISSLLCLCYK